MKKLLIILLLISPFSFADWGDVYYCEMTTNSLTILEGERTDYQLEKFQFKLDKTKNAMVFGKGGYMNGVVAELNKNWRAMVTMEVWRANDGGSMSFFSEGKFLHVRTGPSGSTSISADCDKF
jgi:hypothetical protein|tara:strand:+ start:1004 stop:1372 length:369 start_codon:yes stop_codon:yes gene_type:complete